MSRVTRPVITALIFTLGVAPSWGGPPNPTESDESLNTAGGRDALENVTSGGNNTAFGAGALEENTTGHNNTACGAFALASNTQGGSNTASGYTALANNDIGSLNTASGRDALFANTNGNNNTANGYTALRSNTDGDFNTASGVAALFSNIHGNNNTASGHDALRSNTSGGLNTASGDSALHASTTGDGNTATGGYALFSNTTGYLNTAAGLSALGLNSTGTKNSAFGVDALVNSTGNQNIAVGYHAGGTLLSGNKNIYIGHPGASSESKTMRLGNAQTRTFIAGVADTAVSGVPVHITAKGRLGTQPSSARYKQDIAPMGERSAGVLHLRPVTFVYTEDEQGTRQYGLIAEEVAAVYPELVTHTSEGQVQAVRYQELIPMLVNELQRQQQALGRQQEALDQQHGLLKRQERELADLQAMVVKLRGPSAEQEGPNSAAPAGARLRQEISQNGGLLDRGTRKRPHDTPQRARLAVRSDRSTNDPSGEPVTIAELAGARRIQ